MPRSVLEDEISRRLATTRANLAAHDRGVVLGFMLSLMPIFPVPLVGLAIGLFHSRAHRSGRLSEFDHRLSRRGILFALVNTLISALLVFLAIHLASTSDIAGALTYLPRRAIETLRTLFHLTTSPGAVSV